MTTAQTFMRIPHLKVLAMTSETHRTRFSPLRRTSRVQLGNPDRIVSVDTACGHGKHKILFIQHRIVAQVSQPNA